MQRSRNAAVAMLLFAAPLQAAQLCDAAPCQVNLDFDSGGTLLSNSGATIVFNDNGVLDLGEGGSLSLGESGSVTPDPGEGQPPNMGNGGTLVLGPGDAIQFGAGGQLVTAGGNLSFTDGGDLSVSGATSIRVESSGSVRLGTLASSGTITLVAGCSVDTAGAIALDLATANDDPETAIYVESGQDISVGALNSSNIQLFEGCGDNGGEGGSGGFTTEPGTGDSALRAPPSGGAFTPVWLLLFACWSAFRRDSHGGARPNRA